METITITNQKGGMGKSTTALCMAAILEKRGKKTLFIDADSQCNSTDTYRAEIDGVATLYDLILDDDPCSVDEAIQHTETGDIIAGDPQLYKADRILSRVKDGSYRLRNALKDVKGYDYIIIDTNPSMNLLLENALVATDRIVIPMTAGRYSVQGLASLTETIETVKKYMNPKLTIDGILLTMFNERTNLNRDVHKSMESLAEELGTKLYKTYIRQSIKLQEAQAKRMPLIEYAPRCTTEQDYESLVKEVFNI